MRIKDKKVHLPREKLPCHHTLIIPNTLDSQYKHCRLFSHTLPQMTLFNGVLNNNIKIKHPQLGNLCYIKCDGAYLKPNKMYPDVFYDGEKIRPITLIEEEKNNRTYILTFLPLVNEIQTNSRYIG